MNIFIVTGGRDFHDISWINDRLDEIHSDSKVDLLIQGDAKGLDTYCKVWCRKNDINHITIPAKWKTYGKSAGPIRNEEMLKLALDNFPHSTVTLLSFPGGKGTAHMTKICFKNEKVNVIKLEKD